MKNRDPTLSMRHQHLKIWGYTLHCIPHSNFAFLSVSCFSVKIFCAFLLLSSAFQCVSTAAPVYSATGSSWVSVLRRNRIPLILLHQLSHRGWQLANTMRGKSSMSISMNVSMLCLAENNIAFAFVKKVICKCKYSGTSHNRCSKLVYCFMNKLFSICCLLFPSIS